jgi:hypothetical protein
MFRLARNIYTTSPGRVPCWFPPSSPSDSFTASSVTTRSASSSLRYSNVVAATMDLGISSTIVREVAAREVSSPAYVERLLRTAASFYWTCYVILATTLFLMAGMIAQTGRTSTRWIRQERN